MKRLASILLLLAPALAAALEAQPGSPGGHQAAIRAIVQQFESALQARDLPKIEAVVADDLVVFENGHRNDGWADFRDHHLVPEMKEPAPPTRTELLRSSATAEMGWAYTKSEMTLTRNSGEKVVATLWSIYVLEKRRGQWKIVMLDWSMHLPRPSNPK